MNKKLLALGTAFLLNCGSQQVIDDSIVKEELLEEDQGYTFSIEIENREEILNCVYQVETEHNYQVLGTGFYHAVPGMEGSATAISLEENRAYLVTNYHVVNPLPLETVLSEEEEMIRREMRYSGVRPPQRIRIKHIDAEITITLNGEEIIVNNSEEWQNEREDLALLVAELTNEELEYFQVCNTIGNDQELEQGQTFLSVGFQIEGNLLTQGIYSGSLSRIMGSSEVLVNDYEVIPGFSGGAVFAVRNEIAELVGINRNEWMNYGLIVPISVIRTWLEELEMDFLLE